MRFMKISVVIPTYGCPEALEPLHKRLVETLVKITKNYEIIFVNDSCPKGSWQIIEKICRKDKKVVGINLSRNFGQVHSTNAGINYASGDFVVLMDCDLQDRPEAIIELYKTMKQEVDCDIVFSKRTDRKDTKTTLLLSNMFYKVYNFFIDGYFDGNIGNQCIVNKKVVEEYKKIQDQNKSFINYLFWMGFNSKTIELIGDKRYEGKSSYTLRKKIKLAVETITSQSNKPLKLFIKFGMLIALLSFLFLIIQIIMYFVNKNITEGWTSIIASIFLMGGLILTSLGCIGIYIGNIFDQSKGKPEYIIDEILNKKKR